MAKLTFLGAAHGVTGSAYLLQTKTATVLLECGLIQGRREEEQRNRQGFPFDISKLDAVVISHAHLDHSGRLPKLVAEGYQGPVYVTHPTLELLEIMFKDAASLAMRDAEWENRRRRRSGKEEIEPLYTLEDVAAALQQCRGAGYHEIFEIADGIKVCFRDAGHILGSATVELIINEGNRQRHLVFSGDLGNSETALLRDPEPVTKADILLLESTYGDREHRSMEDTLTEFRDIIREASLNGGNILIPSFAVGRTQEIIFHLGELYQQGELQQQAVYLDSPMAIATTEVYHRYQDIFNREDRAQMRQTQAGSLHTFLPILHYSSSTEESMALNRIEGGAIFIAGSGMCNGGRIIHHLKHNLWRKNAHVLMVGYQANGTPGRALVDGARRMHLAGEEIAVRAKIHTLGGFSAHASQSQLLNWVQGFTNKKLDIYLVHGDTDAKQTLQQNLKNTGWNASIAEHGATISF